MINDRHVLTSNEYCMIDTYFTLCIRVALLLVQFIHSKLIYIHKSYIWYTIPCCFVGKKVQNITFVNLSAHHKQANSTNVCAYQTAQPRSIVTLKCSVIIVQYDITQKNREKISKCLNGGLKNSKNLYYVSIKNIEKNVMNILYHCRSKKQ